MPKKSKKGNTKGSRSGSGGGKVAAAASLPTTSPLIPSDEWLLPISEVMEEMDEYRKVKDKLKAGQWLLKSMKGHYVYYRYVIKKGGIQRQLVTHSCTSGSKAESDRARDLIRPEYTDEEGVTEVIKSKLVLLQPEVYPP